ncbi:SPOR domain-containing protein [Fluviicola sp.]|uniref:SPOR domain-containing protein n=1 Tax=Fluviicola sp. TaxID=1917219 RepID=UPI00262C90F6|nr:SPOR domain-containing protein [Fluviicola sp.]
MNNYLLQLLKEVKTLIIPGLGALTVTNESTGEILFMPYLKFDDGTLAKHIASKENMELNDATNLISKFVREVTAELDKGNSYDMYQFGRFIKVDGEIAFEVWSGSATATESTTPPAIEKKEEEAKILKTEASSDKDEKLKEKEIIVPPIVEKPIIEEEKSPVIEQEIKIEKPEFSEPKPVVAETPKAPPVKEEKVIPPVAPVIEKPEAKAPVETPKPQKETVAPKKEAPKKEKVVKEPKAKKKSSVLSYILWGLLVLILGSGTFIAIKFDSLKKDFPILAELAGDNDDVAKGSDDVKVLEDEADVNIDSNTDSEPVPEDQVQVVEDKLPAKEIEKEAKKPATVIKETPAPKPVKENTPKPVTKPAVKPTVTVNKKPVTKTPASTSGSSGSFDSSKSFHVIAGSFGSEANANKLASKLRSQGFGDAAVTMHNGMHRVSVKGFGTLNEATAEAAKIQGSVPGAWVLKL